MRGGKRRAEHRRPFPMASGIEVAAAHGVGHQVLLEGLLSRKDEVPESIDVPFGHVLAQRESVPRFASEQLALLRLHGGVRLDLKLDDVGLSPALRVSMLRV